jgi:hypothetical protein
MGPKQTMGLVLGALELLELGSAYQVVSTEWLNSFLSAQDSDCRLSLRIVHFHQANFRKVMSDAWAG